MIGQTISHYKILEKLGEGGMGVVYKARDLKLPRFVALKFLPPHLSRDESAKRRFINEAEAASALDHPNIGTIYEIDETPDGRMFIAMAYYEGQTLKQRAAAGPVGIDEAIDLVSQIASGLAKAHESDIFHRDIKPANVLLTSDGHAKIVDFGLAKLAGQTRMTRTGTTVGTLSYMSPEQARGDDVDARSDVFSVGVVFYKLLTGKLPFRGDRDGAVIYSIMHADPEPLATCRSDLPQDAQRVIDKALAKELDVRYQSAADLLRDLQRLREGRRVLLTSGRRKIKLGRALMFVGIGILIAAGGYAVLSRLFRLPEVVSPESAAVPASTLAVLPFTVRGGEENADLSEGMVDLLSTRLDGAGDLQCVDPRALTSFARQRAGGASGPELAKEVADQFGAGLYLLGDIMVAGGGLHVTASLYESGHGTRAVAKALGDGDRDHILLLADELAAGLLKDRLRSLEHFPYDPEAVTTESFPALKAYLEGETLFRVGGNLDGAIDAFQRSVEEDSTFALASYGLAKAVWWPMLDVDRTRDAIERALRHSQVLPEQERLRIQAFRAGLHEEDEEAEQLYRTMVGYIPEDFYAWHSLGSHLFFSCVRTGQSPSEAREPLERALGLYPQEWQSIFHLCSVAAIERRYEEVLTLQQRRGSPSLGWRTIVAYGMRDTTAQKMLLAEMAEYSDWYLTIFAVNTAAFTDDYVGSQDVVRLLTESRRSDDVQGLGHILLATLEAARGRWGAARAEFALAEALNPALTIEHRALLAALPFLPVPEPEIRTIRDALRHWDAAGVPASVNPIPWLRIHDDMHAHLRIYLLGLLSARLGEDARALGHADELERMTGSSYVTDLIHDLACGLRAQVAWKQGKPTVALEECERTRLKSPDRYWLYSPFYKELLERSLRAELLHELGCDEEALRWISSFGVGWGIDFVFSAPLSLRRASYYERAGQPEKAAEHYAKFVDFWQDCDEELRPQVADAKAKLDKLTAASKSSP
jgi:tRNA A-37 threonylcarbamoyl transferase component Bud32/tetratricopeptide (TPR) repeat protein